MSCENMHVLRKIVESGDFHHATYRNQRTLWEGLWFYRKAAAGFRGYEVAGVILKDDPDLDEAYRLVQGTGVSLEAYGVG